MRNANAHIEHWCSLRARAQHVCIHTHTITNNTRSQSHNIAHKRKNNVNIIKKIIENTTGCNQTIGNSRQTSKPRANITYAKNTNEKAIEPQVPNYFTIFFPIQKHQHSQKQETSGQTQLCEFARARTHTHTHTHTNTHTPGACRPAHTPFFLILKAITHWVQNFKLKRTPGYRKFELLCVKFELPVSRSPCGPWLWCCFFDVTAAPLFEYAGYKQDFRFHLLTVSSHPFVYARFFAFCCFDGTLESRSFVFPSHVVILVCLLLLLFLPSYFILLCV